MADRRPRRQTAAGVVTPPMPTTPPPPPPAPRLTGEVHVELHEDVNAAASAALARLRRYLDKAEEIGPRFPGQYGAGRAAALRRVREELDAAAPHPKEDPHA